MSEYIKIEAVINALEPLSEMLRENALRDTPEVYALRQQARGYLITIISELKVAAERPEIQSKIICINCGWHDLHSQLCDAHTTRYGCKRCGLVFDDVDIFRPSGSTKVEIHRAKYGTIIPTLSEVVYQTADEKNVVVTHKKWPYDNTRWMWNLMAHDGDGYGGFTTSEQEALEVLHQKLSEI